MKMRMHYRQYSSDLVREAVLVGHEEEHSHPYNFVLGSMLWGGGVRTDYWKDLLNILDQVAQAGDDSAETLGYNDWSVEVRPDRVQMELLIDEACRGAFPMQHVRRAVEGWISFLEMPKSPETEVIVDLDA